jgi:peptidoglycan/LPS O-acetylase OafA/YrhL
VLWGGLSWERFGLHLSTQGYLDHRVPDLVNLPSWSLTTEVQFYVVAPLVAVAVRWGRGWPLLALTLVTSTWWIGWAGRGDIAASLLPGRLDQFVAGAVVGELVARGSDSRVRRLVARPYAGVVLLLALLALGTWHGATFQQEAGGNGWLEDATHPIAGVLIAALVLRWLTGDAPRFLSWTPWRFLGTISFGLYLWHYPVLLYGLDWLGIRGEGAAPSPPVTLLVCVALVGLSVLLATLSYVGVESRFATDRDRRQPAVGGTAPVPAREAALAD